MSKRSNEGSLSWLRKLPRFLRRLLAGESPTITPTHQPSPRDVEPRTPRIGLALSSGGSKGLCHIGVIEVLEENNIPIHVISGSSMGSYIAALYASGCSVDEMKALAMQIGTGKTFSKLADPANPLKGIIHGQKAKLHLEETIRRRTFDSFAKQLLVVAADLDTFESIVFREGIVSDAVHASCAIPGIVVPPSHKDRRLTDGGIVEPVPVQPLIDYGDVDHIIAVSTVRRLDDLKHPIKAREMAEREAELLKPPNSKVKAALQKFNRKINPAASGNVMDTLRRSIRAGQIRLADQACKQATIALHPGVDSPSKWHDYHRFEEYIEYGRQVALDALPQLKKLTEPIVHDHRKKTSVVGDWVA